MQGGFIKFAPLQEKKNIPKLCVALLFVLCYVHCFLSVWQTHRKIIYSKATVRCDA